MRNRRQYWAGIFVIVPFLTIPILVQAQNSESDVCMHSFERYAYQGIRDPDEVLQLPTHPWELVDNVSETVPKDYYISHIGLIRHHDTSIEIWLGAGTQGKGWPLDAPYAPNTIKGSQRIWLVYSPQTFEMKIIPAEIQGKNLIVYELFIDDNGLLWGSLIPKNSSNAGTFPILSMFNESQQRFELINENLEIPIGSSPMVVQSTDNRILWIFVNNNSLYAFDTETQTISKEVDLSDIEPLYITKSIDGTLYFSTRLGDPSAPGYASLEQETLYQFFPESNELTQITIPKEWPIYRGLLSDSEGRLWLGSIGFRGTDGTWNLMYPYPEQFFEYPLTSSRTIPTLLFESSDGRLWYTSWWDGGIWYDGTAWYDPQIDEGCMFTNVTSSIDEDAEQRLWLVANGNLYKYILNP